MDRKCARALPGIAKRTASAKRLPSCRTPNACGRAGNQNAFASDRKQRVPHFSTDRTAFTIVSRDGAAYQKMGEALRATHRPILYALCEYGLYDVPSWGRKVGANLWRTTGDIDIGSRWESIVSNGFEHNGKLEHAGADGWNDPDDLLIGKSGMTIEEDRAQMTLWSIMAAPLFVGLANNPMDEWTPAIKAILTNKEVIAVDQDALGIQGHLVLHRGPIEVWTRRLSDGTTAVAVFNLSRKARSVHVRWPDLALGKVRGVRDLWRKGDLGSLPGGYEGALQAHGAVLLKVAAQG